MSDIHKRVVRRALLQAARRVVDPVKVKRGLLSFRSRKAEEKNFRGFSVVSIASKRKRQASSRVEEGDSSFRSRVKRFALPKLPPKLDLLQAFYDGLEAAVSLLALRRERCTFESVRKTVEATTQRLFLHQHLAQIKHILPEAVKLEYIRCRDSDLRREKWGLCISLLPIPSADVAADDEIEFRHVESSKVITLKQIKPKIETVKRRQAFHSRLLEFASTHLEEDDVPEGPLPERLFKAGGALTGCGNSNGLEISKNLGQSSSTKAVRSSESNDIEFELPPAMTCIPLEINTTPHRYSLPESEISISASHFSQSFQPQFSSKKPLDVVMNSAGFQCRSNSESSNLAFTTRFSHFSESFKPHFSARSVIERYTVHSSTKYVMSIDSQNPSPLLMTPVKASAEESHQVTLFAQASGAINSSNSPCTPQFAPSTTVPSNSNLSQIMSSNSPSNSPYATPLKRTATIRSLCFKTPLKMSSFSAQGRSDPEHCSTDFDYAQMPNSEVPLTSEMEAAVSNPDTNVVHSLQARLVHKVIEEEKKKALGAQSSKTLELQQLRQLMLAGLPQLFNQLCLIFQSCNHTVIPGKELVSKVLSSNTEMADQGEVEEQLKLLLELVPDWISVKSSIAGDHLYRINKCVDVMGVHKRLFCTMTSPISQHHLHP